MSSDQESRWMKTRNLMGFCLLIWALAGLVVHLFVEGWNDSMLFGLPLGYFATAHGSVIVGVVLLFWFARRQDAIDRTFGAAKDE